MTDHIHDTSAASRPESANLLTPPLREAVAEALMVAYDECWSSMAGAFSVRHAERLADEALAVVRAAMPERGTPALPLPWTEEFCAGWNAAIAEMEARLS